MRPCLGVEKGLGAGSLGREAGVGALRVGTADKLVKMSKGARARRRGRRFSRLPGRSVRLRRVILPGEGVVVIKSD